MVGGGQEFSQKVLQDGSRWSTRFVPCYAVPLSGSQLAANCSAAPPRLARSQLDAFPSKPWRGGGPSWARPVSDMHLEPGLGAPGASISPMPGPPRDCGRRGPRASSRIRHTQEDGLPGLLQPLKATMTRTPPLKDLLRGREVGRVESPLVSVLPTSGRNGGTTRNPRSHW